MLDACGAFLVGREAGLTGIERQEVGSLFVSLFFELGTIVGIGGIG